MLPNGNAICLTVRYMLRTRYNYTSCNSDMSLARRYYFEILHPTKTRDRKNRWEWTNWTRRACRKAPSTSSIHLRAVCGHLVHWRFWHRCCVPNQRFGQHRSTKTSMRCCRNLWFRTQHLCKDFLQNEHPLTVRSWADEIYCSVKFVRNKRHKINESIPLGMLSS